MDILKVFVTGVTGFIGRNLVGALLAKGYEVVGFIRPDLNSRKPALHQYLWQNIQVVYGDLTDFKSTLKALDSVHTEEGITVIHLAAVIDSHNLALFDAVNITGTENLYQALVQTKTPINQVIHISTAAVHGPQHLNEIITEDTSLFPETSYEKSKHDSELIARKFMKELNLPVTVFRPVHVYGPGSVDHLLIPMIKMVRRGFVVAPARQSLDLVYIANFVDALVLAMEKKEVSVGQTYIITDGKTYTTDDVIKNLNKIFSIDPLILRIPKFVTRIYSKLTKKLRYGLNNVSYSSDKAKVQLGYQPKIFLAEGFRAYVGWLVTAGYLDSHYIISNSEAANESLSGFKGVGCAYDYVIRLKTMMPLYRKAVEGKPAPSLLLVTPLMRFCPPLEVAYLKRLVRNLRIRRVVIPYNTPNSSQIINCLSNFKNEHYDFSLYVGEDLAFNDLKTLAETLQIISGYVGIFIHNGDNSYHLGHWQGIKEESAYSLAPILIKHIDMPLMPANINIAGFHAKSMSRVKHTLVLSLTLTILLISQLEDKFPKLIRKKMSHQLFLVWSASSSRLNRPNQEAYDAFGKK
jgi:nucleoside-diphosphate-sugar epimerase